MPRQENLKFQANNNENKETKEKKKEDKFSVLLHL
jgi:hypothetical protein